MPLQKPFHPIMSHLGKCGDSTYLDSGPLFLDCNFEWNPVEIHDQKNVTYKVHIFSEGHNFLWNLHHRFVLCSNGQIYGGHFAKFCGLLRIYELYHFWIGRLTDPFFGPPYIPPFLVHVVIERPLLSLWNKDVFETCRWDLWASCKNGNLLLFSDSAPIDKFDFTPIDMMCYW